jgi:hypothetical protein
MSRKKRRKNGTADSKPAIDPHAEPVHEGATTGKIFRLRGE